MRYLFAALLFIGLFSVRAQQLPAERTTNWSLAGMRTDAIEPTRLIDASTYGLPNDGVTVADTVWATIMDSAVVAPCIIQLPAGEYLFKTPWNLPDSVVVRGAGSDSTKLYFDLSRFTVGQNAISIGGRGINTWHDITEAISAGDTTLVLDTALNLQPGTYLLLRDDDSDKVISTWALKSTGQVVQVDSMLGNTIYISSPMRRGYSLTDAPELQIIEPATQVGIENLYIDRVDATTGQSSNIRYNYAANCWVKCVESYRTNYAHIEVNRSTNLSFTGNVLHHAHAYGGGGQGYGIMLQYTTGEVLVQNNIAYHLRHSYILQAGSNGNVFGYNYSFDPNWDDAFLPSNSAGDLVLHGNYPYLNLFEGNVVQNIVIDNSHDINGPYNTFLRNRGESYGLFMNTGPATDSQNYIGNEISYSGSSSLQGLYLLFGNGHFEYGNNHKGTIKPSGTDSVWLNTLYLPEGKQWDGAEWPVIGPPNTLVQHTNLAQQRWDGGEGTMCSSLTLIDIPEDTVVVPIDTGDTTSIMHLAIDPIYNVYPNPSKGTILIEYNSEFPAQWTITDINGAIVEQGKLEKGTQIIDLTQRSAGVYFYQLRLIDGNVETGKLVLVE